jgi:leader peptidase (prepilin peptidase) / N-methyltransferase
MGPRGNRARVRIQQRASSLRPVQWFVVALIAAVCAMVWRFGWSWALPGYVLFAVTGTLLAAIDATARRVPDVILVPAAFAGAATLCLASAVEGEWAALARAGVGAAVLLGFYLVLIVMSPDGVGLGDVKLAGFIGVYLAWLSWRALAFGTMSAFLLAALATVPLLAMRRIKRSTRIPFAPFMVTGAVVAIVSRAEQRLSRADEPFCANADARSCQVLVSRRVSWARA